MESSFQDPCPPAYYCLTGSDPILCPVGTLRATPGAASTGDCNRCTGGFYCPGNGTENIEGQPCSPGFVCPEGSVFEQLCPGGTYCPGVSAVGIVCPAAHYCPDGTANPIWCMMPYYCPAGTEIPQLCPLGFKAIPHSMNRTSQDDSCLMCPGGTYGNHSERSYCAVCPAQYYCPPGTYDPIENPCPPGHYCPEGSSAPVPCDSGYYNMHEKSYLLADCVPCPSGAYNNKPGQPSCRPCGSSAKSDIGQTLCTCAGKFRSFQTSDGSCICNAG